METQIKANVYVTVIAAADILGPETANFDKYVGRNGWVCEVDGFQSRVILDGTPKIVGADVWLDTRSLRRVG